MAVSRRAFLGSVAAVPIAAALEGTPLLAASAPRIAVVGAGAFGGWTALQLQRLGARVMLVDAWGPGNARASSGGETRVIRAIYGGNRTYVEMVKRAYELWEQLDPALYIETGALWMHRGDDAYARTSAPVLRELGFAVEELQLDHAARKYPQVDLRGVKTVWLEKRAGALSARRACMAVRDAFQRAGGSYRVAHVRAPEGNPSSARRAPSPLNGGEKALAASSLRPRTAGEKVPKADEGAVTGDILTSLQTDDGSRIEADVYVFACGPWLGRMFPEVPIAPTRQEVFFFGAPAGSDRYGPSKLPVWIDFGERILYGVPDVDGRGFKVADDTRGELFDPTNGNREPSAEGLARARVFLAERFPELAKAPLIEARVCQYENSPDGHLILDRHPALTNVWVAGGGSGHGFKLGPAVGDLLARRILKGTELPSMFRLGRFAPR
jgi:sarcosine oxidase